MRVLWSKREASYEGEIVRFPPVRCEPKPLQKPHPPVILGAHGPKALERVARTYDGWMPLTDSPEEMKRDAAVIRIEGTDYLILRESDVLAKVVADRAPARAKVKA